MKLSSVKNFDVEKIIFSEAKESAIPGSYRITIGTQFSDKSVGPLLFCTDEIYSFGVQENKSLDKPIRTTGYSIPLCLWNRDGPTQNQLDFIDTIQKVSDHIIKYLLKTDVKKSFKKYDLVESDLRKFCPLWYKKEDGKIVEGRGPMLYPKLITDRNLKIYTIFADQRGFDIKPMTLIGEKCSVKAIIKIESIFIGSKISLQVKVQEVEVQRQGSKMPRLLCKEAPAEEENLIEDTDVVNPLVYEEKLVLSDEEKEVVTSPPALTKTSRGGRRIRN